MASDAGFRAGILLEADRKAEQKSNAWVAFARTGNPNHAKLPNWEPYDNIRRAVMIFNDECKLLNDPYGSEQRLLRSLQGRA